MFRSSQKDAASIPNAVQGKMKDMVLLKKFQSKYKFQCKIKAFRTQLRDQYILLWGNIKITIFAFQIIPECKILSSTF